MRLARPALALLVLPLLTAAAAAQSGPSRWSSYASVGPVAVDRSTLGTSLALPIYNRNTNTPAQLRLTLIYNSQFWNPTGGGWQPASGGGWGLEPSSAGVEADTEETGTCGWYDMQIGPPDDGSGTVYTTTYTLEEPDGAAVAIPYTFQSVDDPNGPPPPGEADDCPAFYNSAQQITVPDGKGYTVAIDATGDAQAVYDRSGDEVDAGFTDRNGNYAGSGCVGATCGYVDPLGVALTLSGYESIETPLTYTFTGPDGNPATITEQFESLGVATSFGCPGVREYSGALTVPSALNLPGGSYAFGYDTGGRLSAITLPTGATVNLSYGAMDCASGGANNVTLTAWDSVDGEENGWSWALTDLGGGDTETAETPPGGNQAEFSFGPAVVGGESGTLATAAYYQGAQSGGTLLEQMTVASTVNANGVASQTTMTEMAPQNGAPAVYRVSTADFDAYGNPTAWSDSDRSTSPSGGAPLRGANLSYVASGYGEALSSAVVSDGAGNQAARTDYGYDGNSNLLSVKRYTTASAFLTQSFAYNPNGTVASASDVNGAITNYAYGSGSCGGLFPTEVDSPTTAIKTTAGWYCDGGVPNTVTDANGQPTSYGYSGPGDSWALAKIAYPDGGETDLGYTATTLDLQRKQSASAWEDTFETLDGLARPSMTATEATSGQWSRMDACYNAVGQTSFVSYPYYASSDTGAANCAGTGDSYSYDGLGRETVLTHSDGSTFLTSYGGSAVETQDEGNGTRRVTRVIQADGLGQLSGVCEVTSQADAAGNAPAACGLDLAATGFHTTYTHDALGNLTGVAQGAETRTFAYDGLSRLTSAKNPENGTVNYTYDVAACGTAAYAGALTCRTDARGITTAYSYDADHRLSSRVYSDGTPGDYFIYDNQGPGSAPQSPVGRLTTEYTESAGGQVQSAVSFAYDAMGEVEDEQPWWWPTGAPGATPCCDLLFTRNLVGQPLTIGNGLNTTYNYAYDLAG
ncbi:MAG: hypothetical protein ACRD01_00525, partial [Terriglobales bacterium]